MSKIEIIFLVSSHTCVKLYLSAALTALSGVSQVQNVMDGLIESADALSVFYVLPEVDGFLAVLFLKFLCLESCERVYVVFGKLLKIGIGNCIFKLNSP